MSARARLYRLRCERRLTAAEYRREQRQLDVVIWIALSVAVFAIGAGAYVGNGL